MVYEMLFKKKGSKRWLRTGNTYKTRKSALVDFRWYKSDKKSKYHHKIKKR